MFKKKKKQEENVIQHNSYSGWDNELGFLFLILNRKKEMTKKFIIEIYSGQLGNVEQLSDDVLETEISKTTEDTIAELSESYKNFICSKYFNGIDALINFITEDVYNDFITTAISLNNDKVKLKMQESIISFLEKQNSGTK